MLSKANVPTLESSAVTRSEVFSVHAIFSAIEQIYLLTSLS